MGGINPKEIFILVGSPQGQIREGFNPTLIPYMPTIDEETSFPFAVLHA